MSNRIAEIPLPGAELDQNPYACEIPDETAAAVLGKGKQLVNKLEQVVAAHPAAALGVALATGVILGWWVKRR